MHRGQTALPSLLGARAAVHWQCPTERGTAPAGAVSRDTFPVHQAPSISTNSAVQLGMVNQPLTQQRREGCTKSSTGSETAPQQPLPSAAFLGTGRQREGKGSLKALPAGLNCVGRSQMREQVFAELHVKHCCLPLVQITALPGLGGPAKEVSSTARLNAELHTSLT